MKKLENSQMIHIITEVVVLLGMCLYFSNKNKRLQSLIEELSQRIEEQDDQIQKIQNVVQQMINQQSRMMQKMDAVPSPPVEKKKKTVTIQDIKQKPKKEVKKEVQPQPIQVQAPSQVQPMQNPIMSLLSGLTGMNVNPTFSPNIEVVQQADDEPDISDDELDEELEDELTEMKNETELKKN